MLHKQARMLQWIPGKLDISEKKIFNETTTHKIELRGTIISNIIKLRPCVLVVKRYVLYFYHLTPRVI